MATKNQHYVPRVYIKSWETTVYSKKEPQKAFTGVYYYDKADFVEANIEFKVSENEDDETSDTADLSEINTGDDAISVLNDIVEDGESAKGTIAVIDTGINADDLIDKVSLLGDDVSDDNGHGTKMYNYIREEDADAKILSIKAMDKNGKGQVSDVYAAIQYAIEKKADITVVCKDMDPDANVDRYGTVKLDDDCRIEDFEEKAGVARSNTISCGIYRGVCDYENDLRVLKDIADELLYKVKKTGKNGFMFKADPLLPTGDIDIDDSSISLKGAMDAKINNSIS